MRLATVKRGGRDGTLVVATADGGVATVPGWPTLQAALDDGDAALPTLDAAASGRASEYPHADDFAAPLPRPW